jgi:iron complex transport system substrate-binding protein
MTVPHRAFRTKTVSTKRNPPSFAKGGGRRFVVAGPCALALLLAALTGCKPAPTAVAPATGQVRVVSLAPSITEIVCAVGAADQLVGRTSACDVPADIVARVPVIGAFGVPSIERILAVKPGIVLYADIADESMAQKLERAGLTQARIKCTRLDDIPSAIQAVGRYVHHEEEARELTATLNRQIREIRARTAALDRQPSVLVLIWNDPLTAAGRDGFLSDLVALAGGRHIGDTIHRDYFQVSSEWVLAQNPDIIFCFFMAGNRPVRQTILQQSGWGRVKAVQTGRVYDGFDNNLVLRPGPRVLEGVEAIRRCITGEAAGGGYAP